MKFETGDVLLEKGDGLLSNTVQLATDSPYSHVALIFRYPTIIQAHALGVHLREIQSLTKVDVMRIKNGLSEKEKEKLLKGCINEFIGRKYDIGQFIGGGKYLNDPESMICSELVDKIYNYIGYDILQRKELGSVTPANISESDSFEFVAKDINAEELKLTS